MRRWRGVIVLALGGAFLAAGAVGGEPALTAAPVAANTFTVPSRADDPAISVLHEDPAWVNEPATAVGKDGARYVAYQATWGRR